VIRRARAGRLLLDAADGAILELADLIEDADETEGSNQ